MTTTTRLTSRGVYITSGAGGFYYRQHAGVGVRRIEYVPRPMVRAPGREVYATETIASSSVEQLSDLSQDQFVTSLNEWTTRGALQIIAVAAIVVGVIITNAFDLHVTGELLIYGAIGFALARFVERRRRRFLLMLDLGPAGTARFERLSNALADLATSGSFRGVTQIGHHADWKRSGGATRELALEQAMLRPALPPYIVSNITPWMLATQGLKLYFFPDRILIYSGRKFAALSYDQLVISCEQSRFVWDDALPHDARIVGDTWLYVRRDGGPDNRFNNNRQIPLVLTARLSLHSTTGLAIVLQSTKVHAAEQAAAETQAYGEVAAIRVAPLALREHAESVANALTVLGFNALPALDQLRQGYRDLIARNQPAQIGRDSRELQVLASHRLAELDAAYAVVRVQLGGDPTESDGRVLALLAPEVLPLRWMRDERIASLVAAAAVLALFIAFRISSSVQPLSPNSAVVIAAPARSVASTPPPAPAASSITRRVVIACPLRELPSSSARVLAGIAVGTELALLGENSGWRRVRDPSGREGWTGPLCWQLATPKATRSQAPKSQPSSRPASSPPLRPAVNPVPVDPYASPEREPVPPPAQTSAPSSTGNTEPKQMPDN